MGVPSYFYWLVSRFEDVILHHEYPYEKDIGYLFLDFNSQIHPAVKADPNMKLADMYQAVIKYLETIVELLNQQKESILQSMALHHEPRWNSREPADINPLRKKKRLTRLKDVTARKLLTKGLILI